MPSKSQRPLPSRPEELVVIEAVLEKLHAAAVLLNAAIRQVEEDVLIERLRSQLTETLRHLDVLGARFDRLVRPVDDRRQIQRMRVVGDLTVVVSPSGEDIAGRCIDASTEGLCAVLPRALTLETRCWLSFHLLGTDCPVQAEGAVRWSRLRPRGQDYQVGFELMGASDFPNRLSLVAVG